MKNYKLIEITRLQPKGPHSDGVYNILLTDASSNEISIECPDDLIETMEYLRSFSGRLLTDDISVPMIWDGSRISIDWESEFPLKEILLTREMLEA